MSQAPPPPPSANAQPRSKASSPPPPLNACIKTMVSCLRNGSALSTRHQADLTVAMVGYCAGLAVDLEKLSEFFRSCNQNGQHEAQLNNGQLVPFSEMPAIRELVTDPSLFQCIISTLSPYNRQFNQSATGMPHPSIVGNAQKMTQQMQMGSRKRSPSEDSTNASNLSRKQKLLLSPTPGNNRPQVKLHQSSGKVDAQKGHGAMNNAPIFAATILYTALQHVDYWPIELMKAYAEDSFGPRTWVDNERMKMLVSNLEISLQSSENSESVNGDNSTTVKHAEEVESYFSSLMAQAEKQQANGTTTSANSSPSKQKPSNSSQQHPKSPSSKQQRMQTKRSKSNDSSDSSSSGEEEVLETESSTATNKAKAHPSDNLESISCMSTASSSNSQLQNTSSISYRSLSVLFQPSSFSKKRVRPRYQGNNLELAHEAISDALTGRLNSKSKQNSRLLQILPSFVSIPRVRCLTSRHLEKWLQSPALAGLSRTLFAKIVTQIRNVDPPLPEDIELIDNILKMNLKSNQFTAHVENIKTIAKTVPTQTVAQQIFTHCLQGESTAKATGASKPTKDHMQMLFSVFLVLDRTVASKSLASSVISMAFSLVERSDGDNDVQVQLHEIRRILGMILDTLGEKYDGLLFVKTIIEAAKNRSKNPKTVIIASRLIFECMVLVTRAIPSINTHLCDSRHMSSSIPIQDIDQESMEDFRKKMLALRKLALSWYVTQVGPVFYEHIVQEEAKKCTDVFDERGAVVRGPGKPDYSSALDGNSEIDYDYHQSFFNGMISSIRCLLFMSPPSSREMKLFASPLAAASGEEMEPEEFQRIQFCCQYGVDVDEEMLQIVLKANRVLTNNSAITIIEILVQNAAQIVGCSADTVWAMYELSEFIPELRQGYERMHLESSDGEDSLQVGTKRKLSNGIQPRRLDLSNLPRLAHPHLWWRVTSIALVMCSISPKNVGAIMWESHPTLRALMKMTASQKYRFPTADCDELERDQIKRREDELREEEGNIAELLFMPPKETKKPRVEVSQPLPHRGLRFSARQREKYERLIAMEQEKQATEIHAENMKLKKLLRTVQKSIMLWDPRQDQRKPPKGSIDLLLSVNDHFELAEKLRLCIEPDFLLQTIGTGRSAIERAYDWLIPIISSHPEIIDRLQPSASCFLLLRAYGVEGDKNRDLLDLAAPLLLHVSNCLTGKYGESHAQLAMDLLLQDLADETAERRRCARKVLQNAIGSVKNLSSLPFQFDLGLCGWLFQLTRNENARSLLPLVIKYVSHALAYERGKVLSIYTLALFEYKRFIKEHEIELNFDFLSSLCELMAQRPHVMSDALDRFPDLRSVAVSEVKNGFDQAIASHATPTQASSPLVVLSLPVMEDGDAVDKLDVVVPANLLQAAIILISNWQNVNCDKDEEEFFKGNENDAAVLGLMQYLIIPFSPEDSGLRDLSGAASAVHKESGARAVTVEEWVLLAKSRTAFVAKHAALSAPDIFMPRLLLCCGMSLSSFITMLHRIGKMGDFSPDPGKVFADLMSPSAVAQWGLPRIGGRRVIKRKLLGRITAYIRTGRQAASNNEMRDLDEASKSSFVLWLSSECSSADVPKKQHSKHQSMKSMDYVRTYATVSTESNDFEDLTGEVGLEKIGMNSSEHYYAESSTPLPDGCISQDFLRSCLNSDSCNRLVEVLEILRMNQIRDNDFGDISAARVLISSLELFQQNSCFVRTVLKWVPLLTQFCCDVALWQLIFIDCLCKPSNFDVMMALVCNCAMRWSNEHIDACQSWILSQQSKCTFAGSIYSLKVSLRFLVISSEQKPIQCFDFGNDANASRLAYMQTQESAISAITHALEFLELAERTAARCNGESPRHLMLEGQKDLASRRNVLPDWLALVMLVSRTNRQYLEMTIKYILEHTDKRPSCTLSLVLLRLYTTFPLSMKLGESRLRNALLQASTEDPLAWMQWRCPLDAQVSEMIRSITASPHQRLCQSIIDMAKQHPLILVRHLQIMRQKLLDDGSGVDSDNQTLIKRGRIQGKSPEGDVIAFVGEREVMVTITQWGFSFSEPAWAAILDVLMSLPVEVAFTCGLKAGLGGVLEVYLKLLFMHVNILQAESNIVRVREKLAKFLNSFFTCKAEAFHSWSRQKVSGWGTVGSLMTNSGMGQLMMASDDGFD